MEIADDQALRFLDDLLHPTTGGFFRLDLLRAYQLVRLTDLSDKWVELVCEHASTMRHRVVSLSQLVYHAKKRHQSILACALIDLIVAESSTRPPLRSLTLDRQRMTDWAVSLIADSLEINNAQAEDSSDYFEEHKGSSPHCDEIISRIARTLYTHPEAMVASGLEQITLALALHTLYLQFIADSQVPDLHNDTILELAMVIDERTKNVNEDDLDVVLRAFRTLPNLLVLVQVLDATELYSLAITLLDRMIYDFAQLRKTTNTLLGDNSQGHSITVRSLEALIDEIEQRRLAAAEASGWRFDYDLGHWVQQDSDQMESAAINTNTSSERHDSIFPDDDGDDQYINTEQWMERRPATRSVTHGNRRLSLFSSASPRKPPSTTKRQHQPSKASYNDGDNCVDFEKDPNDFDRLLSFTGGRDDPDRTSSSHRFSMAPYRRPIRSTRKQVRYFDMDDARDSDSDEAHSLMDSSSGGTDMEESSQEVSLDTMESPSVDYIGESEDEEMNMDAEDASLINDTSLIEGLSGWHFESLPRTCSPELKSADLSPASQHESWSEQYEEEPESLDGDNVQRFDSENFSPPSNMQQSMALESSSSSDSSGEESDMWLPTPITRKEGTRKRQRKKRKTDGREDVWSSSDSSGSSSGSREEVYPRTRCAPSPTRRQPPKRRFKPVVEITHCRSRGGGVSKNSMSGGMHIHRGSSQVYLGDTHPIEQNIEDDENGVPCLERRKQEPSLRAGLSTITSHAEQASKQAFDDLYHEIEQMENDDEDSECFASDSDEEWLPRARQKQRRRPKQISSSERDQRLLLAVGEPLPLTEADELAF
ncbi:hypothetical protein BGW41_005244 [Actinomortierella wolfii]|nr:hypothetical protein BGW41_005244 [Actinomortierella wolfii]